MGQYITRSLENILKSIQAFYQSGSMLSDVAADFQQLAAWQTWENALRDVYADSSRARRVLEQLLMEAEDKLDPVRYVNEEAAFEVSVANAGGLREFCINIGMGFWLIAQSNFSIWQVRLNRKRN